MIGLDRVLRENFSDNVTFERKLDKVRECTTPRGYVGIEHGSWREWKKRFEWQNVLCSKKSKEIMVRGAEWRGDGPGQSWRWAGTRNVRGRRESRMSPEFLDQAEWTYCLQTWEGGEGVRLEIEPSVQFWTHLIFRILWSSRLSC